MSKITLTNQATDPPTPATGQAALYVKGKKPHVIDDAGLVTDLAVAGGAVSSVHGRTGAVVSVAGDYDAGETTFAPDGDIAAATVQAAVVEVRDDTDTKLAGKLATSHEGAGGAVHAAAIAAGASGFMTGVHVTKLDGITAGAEPNTVDSVHGRTGAVVAVASDYDASEVDFAPDGDIAATTAQTAIVEVRDDAASALGSHAGSGGAAHADAVDGGASGFMTGAQVTKLAGLGGAAIRGLSGFSASNYYERAAGSALGGNGTGWEAMTIAILDVTAGLGATMHLAGCDGANAGWWVGAENFRPKFSMRSGAGGFNENFFGYWLRDMSTKLLFVTHISYDGATMRAYVNGELFWSQAITGMAAGTAAFRLGLQGGAAANPATESTIAGFAFKDDGVLSAAQRMASIVDFLTSGGAIADGAWTSKYEISGEAVGAAPATLSDGIASIDLTLLGALSVIDDASLGLARTSEFDVDAIVVRNSGLITRSTQTVSATGPTTTTAEFLLVDCSSNAVGLTLPSFPVSGGRIQVFDTERNAGTNAITINRAGTQLIDGLTTYVMQNDGQTVSFTFDGTDWHTATGAFVSAANGEGFDSLGEIHVGIPEAPAELVVGGGDSYLTDVFVYTEDAVSTFTDRSGDATFAFDGTAAGNAIYIASDKQDVTDYLRFPGLKVTTSVAIVLGAGAIICEYWNGSAWVQMPQMVSDAGGAYHSHASTPFERVAIEQVRYSQDAVSVQWTKNDPPAEGTARFWVRYRIVTGITTSPTMTQIKLHTDRFEINPDGFAEMFGKARPLIKLPWDLGLIRPAAASPLNQDVYLSDNLDVGRVENKFVSGTTDRIGFATMLPGSTCTSCPAIFVWKYFTDGTSAGDIRWVIRWGFSSDGDNVYPTATAAPTTGGNEQSTVLVVAAPTAINTQDGQRITMNIEDFIANGAAGDVFWMTLERTGGDAADTHTDDVTVIAVKGEHVTWTLGGHL